MTTKADGNGDHKDRIPKCVTGEEAHFMLAAAQGGQQCGKCGMSPLQIKLHAVDQLLTYLTAAVMMLLHDGDGYEAMQLNLLNAATYSGHIVPIAEDPDAS